MAYDHNTSFPLSLEARFVRFARHVSFHQFADDHGVYFKSR